MKLTNSYTLGKKATTALLIALFALLLIPISVMASNTAKATELKAENEVSPNKTITADNWDHAVFKVLPNDLLYSNQYWTLGSDHETNYAYSSNGSQLTISRTDSQTGSETATYTPLWRVAGFMFDHWDVYDANGGVSNLENGKYYHNEDFTKMVAVYRTCGIITGTVIDGGVNDMGDPINNCLVEFYTNGFYAQTRSNSDGSFSISADIKKGGSLEITKEGYRSCIKQIEAESTSPLDLGYISLYKPNPDNAIKISGKVYGRFTNEEEPVALGGANVYYGYNDSDKGWVYTKSYEVASESKLTNELEYGEFEIYVDKDTAGTLYISHPGQSGDRFEKSFSADDTTVDIRMEDESIILDMGQNSCLVEFQSDKNCGSIFKTDFYGTIEGTYLSSAFNLYTDVNIDWNTGSISLENQEGQVVTYTPQAKEGYAYYDWSIFEKTTGTPISFKLEDVLDGSRKYSVEFKPAGYCNGATTDPHHNVFKCTHTTDDFEGQEFTHSEKEFNDVLYAGTKIFLQDGKLHMLYEADQEINDAYSQENVVEAIGEDGYVVNNYYVDGVAITEDSEPVTVAQNSTYTINVDYKLENPVDPVNPDVPGEGENADSSAATGDFAPFAVLAVIAVAAGASAFVISRKRKFN